MDARDPRSPLLFRTKWSSSSRAPSHGSWHGLGCRVAGVWAGAGVALHCPPIHHGTWADARMGARTGFAEPVIGHPRRVHHAPDRDAVCGSAIAAVAIVNGNSYHKSRFNLSGGQPAAPRNEGGTVAPAGGGSSLPCPGAFGCPAPADHSHQALPENASPLAGNG